MDLLSHSLDILFLILALAFVPHSPFAHSFSSSQQAPSIQIDSEVEPRSPALSPSPSPSPSPSSFLSVPSAGNGTAGTIPAISVTPDQPSHEITNTKASKSIFGNAIVRRSSASSSKHGRKSVSFSLSSMDDLHLSLPSPLDTPLPNGHSNANGNGKRPRPPTPFVRGPKSPSEAITSTMDISPLTSPRSTIPLSPLVHNAHVEDPMGVKKQWLMA